MFPEFQLVPWLYFLPFLAWILLLAGLFLRKLFLALAVCSVATAIAFVVCGIAFGMGIPVLCAFSAIEGILFFRSLGRQKEGGDA